MVFVVFVAFGVEFHKVPRAEPTCGPANTSASFARRKFWVRFGEFDHRAPPFPVDELRRSSPVPEDAARGDVAARSAPHFRLANQAFLCRARCASLAARDRLLAMGDSRDWGFEVRVIGEAPPEGVRVDWPPLPANLRAELLESFRFRFARHGGLPTDGAVQVPGYPPTVVHLDAPERSAGVVWFGRQPSEQYRGRRDRLRLSALAVLLTGLDSAVDDRAVARAHQLALDHRAEIEIDRFDEFVRGARPLAVFFASSAAAMYDPTYQFTFGALAQAFFEHAGARGAPLPSDDSA